MPGSISGPQLGEAAHRLLKNSLNIKSSPTSSGYSGQMLHRNHPNNNATYRPRAVGPLGYDPRFSKDPVYYHTPEGIVRSPKPSYASNGYQGNKQNFKAQERFSYQEQYLNIGNGMSNLTIDGGARSQQNAVMPMRMPNPGQSPNVRQQFMQNVGPPPSPPSRWIARSTVGTTSMKQDKQIKQVYQIKSRTSQNMSDSGLQQ